MTTKLGEHLSKWLIARLQKARWPLQDGHRAHVGAHRCDGGPEPSPGQYRGHLQQVEGMPMPAAEAHAQPCSPSEGAATAAGEPAPSSTSGESDTCVDKSGIPGCALLSCIIPRRSRCTGLVFAIQRQVWKA